MGIICKVCSLKYVSALKCLLLFRPEAQRLESVLCLSRRYLLLYKEGPKIMFCRDCWAGLNQRHNEKLGKERFENKVQNLVVGRNERRILLTKAYIDPISEQSFNSGMCIFFKKEGVQFFF